MLQFANQKPWISSRMYNKLAWPAWLRLGPLWWLRVFWCLLLLALLGTITLKSSCCLFLAMPSEVKSWLEKNHLAYVYHLQTNWQQSTCPVIFTTWELKPVLIDSLRSILYAVCLYSAYREFDTLTLFYIIIMNSCYYILQRVYQLFNQADNGRYFYHWSSWAHGRGETSCMLPVC